MNENFVKQALENGGTISPLIIPAEDTKGTGTFNPSVHIIDNKIFVNIRHCQVTLYHSELNKFEHTWGPLVYIHPENDRTLTTTNFMVELDELLNVKKHWKVDTSKLDVEPKWEFRGLEDSRLVTWNNKIYLCGCRRDTTTNGVSRMELSEIQFNNDSWVEVDRQRIPTPIDPDSYAEKNWMPIIDKPYHFVKWSNPTEIVKYDVNTKLTKVVATYPFVETSVNKDFRGNTHVIPFEDYYLGITHTVDMFKSEAGRKNGIYRHCFVGWDKQTFEPLFFTPEFNFMNNKIEFACGMIEHKDNLLITFGVQDNAAYILKVSKQFVKEYINGLQQ